MILTISCLMVLGMVACYVFIWCDHGTRNPDQIILCLYECFGRMNVIAALPLQLIIVGPLSRSVLKAIRKQ